jgi:hypothetical protein
LACARVVHFEGFCSSLGSLAFQKKKKKTGNWNYAKFFPKASVDKNFAYTFSAAYFPPFSPLPVLTKH